MSVVEPRIYLDDTTELLMLVTSQAGSKLDDENDPLQHDEASAHASVTEPKALICIRLHHPTPSENASAGTFNLGCRESRSAATFRLLREAGARGMLQVMPSLKPKSECRTTCAWAPHNSRSLSRRLGLITQTHELYVDGYRSRIGS